MCAFNDGQPYHGSASVTGGKLQGATDNSDYFYFFCPNCPEHEILRILEYGEHERQPINRYNEWCKSGARYGFTLVLKLHCEKCGFTDFVKVSNIGWQGGKHSDLTHQE